MQAEAVELIERDSQLAQLGARFEMTREGRGGLVLVTGEAGAGKSTLVRAAIERGAIPGLVAEATQEATEPYAPIASLLRARLREQPGSIAAVGSLAPFLSLIVPELGPPPPAPSAATLVEALSAWFVGLGCHGRVAVIIDDLQWADTATVELLPRLAADLEHAPVVLVAIYRRDEVTRGHPIRKLRVVLRRAGRLAEVEVEPLGPAGTAELATRILNAPVAESLGAAIYDRTQGVPFFIEELVAALSAEELLASGPQGLALAPGREVPLPDTVRDAVLVMAEQLSDGARAALEVAAVAGQRFELDLLEELEGSVDLEEALELGLVSEVQRGTAAFRHTLVREAIYADVPWPRRRALHHRVAGALERRAAPPRLVAEHWIAAGEQDRARLALLAAADASCAVHAYRDASDALRKAHDLWPNGHSDDTARLGLLERLARCAERSGEHREAVRLWESLVREVGQSDPVRVGEAKRNLAGVYRLLGSRERAATARAEAADAFSEAGACADAVELRLLLTWDCDALGDGAVFDVLDAAERDAGRAGRDDLLARVQAVRGHMLARRGHFDEGAALAAEALALVRVSGPPSAIFDVYWAVAAIGVTRADFAGAIATLEEAAELCRASGLREDEELCIACLAKILAKQGEWDRALELARDVLAADRPPNIKWGALWAAGFILVARGRTNEGRPLLLELAAIGRRFGHTPSLVEALQSLAFADDVDGDTEAAAEHTRELLDAVQSKSHDGNHFAPTLRWASGFYASRRDTRNVNACAAALADLAEQFGGADTLAAVAHALGEGFLLAGDAAEAARHFERAIGLLDEVAAPFESALTKLRAGPAFLAAGDRDVGIDRIVDAYRTFRKLGAHPFATRAAALLKELGEPIERRLGRRIAGQLERVGLTRRELEVLRLVAVGRTNSEIATELVLSPRTIEMHVANALGKLGCRSRTEAAARAHALGITRASGSSDRGDRLQLVE